jgi:GNAT superfamily N-acetyltransferase
MDLTYRVATALDVAGMTQCRLEDAAAGPADARMTAYMQGTHHPQQALAPRIVWVALADHRVVGYSAGHLTRRHKCEGELQYLFVAPSYRRAGVAAELLARLAAWFGSQGAHRVCVNVAPENAPARAFYARYGAKELGRFWYVWTDIQVSSQRGAA